jgi:hypothetical protein
MLSKREKQAFRFFFETGIDGAYQTARPRKPKAKSEKLRAFDDTRVCDSPDGFCLERRMQIGDRNFLARSAFGSGGPHRRTNYCPSLTERNAKKKFKILVVF